MSLQIDSREGFLHFVGIEDSAIHGKVDASGESLGCGDGIADVEGGVACAKTGRRDRSR